MDYFPNDDGVVRWGDYTGITRKQNAGSPEVWLAGHYGKWDTGFLSGAFHSWIAQIRTDNSINLASMSQAPNNKLNITPNPIYNHCTIDLEIIEQQSNHGYEIFPSDNICLTGGVHLNCKANYDSFKNSKFKNIYINYCPSDSGGSIGASLWAWNNVIEKNENKLNQDVYLGPSFDDDFIEEVDSLLKIIKVKKIEINSTDFNKNQYIIVENNLSNLIPDDFMKKKVLIFSISFSFSSLCRFRRLCRL